MENQIKKIHIPFRIFILLWFVALVVYYDYTIHSLFLGSFGERFLWQALAVGLASTLLILFGFKQQNTAKPVMLKGFLLVFGVLFLSEGVFLFLEGIRVISTSWRGTYGQIRFIFKSIGQASEWVALLILTLFVFLSYLLLFLPLQKRYLLFRRLIDKRFDKMDGESYQKWLLAEVTTYPKALDVSAVYRGFMFHLGMMLLLGFLAILRDPSTSGWLSVFFLPAAVGALGLFFVFRQQRTLLDWILKGYHVADDTEIRWNRLIGFFLIPVLILPLLIPWNFRVFNLDALTKSINAKLSGIVVDVRQHPSSSNVRASTNTTVATEREQDRYATQAGKNNGLFGRVLEYLLIFYAGLVVIGGIFRLFRLKGRYRHPIPRFFIFQFNIAKKLIVGIFQVLSIGIRILLSIIGIGGKEQKQTEPDKALKQQLTQLFEIEEAVSEEKKEEMNRVIAAFVKLIEAAGRTLPPYRFFYGPLEYIQKLSDTVPQHQEALLGVVAIFNESRYSLHLIKEERLTEYESAVEDLIEKF